MPKDKKPRALARGVFINGLTPGSSVLHIVAPASFYYHHNLISIGPDSQATTYWNNNALGLSESTNVETGDHNLWYGLGAGPDWSTDDFDDVDPQFVVDNPEDYYDFRLKDSSPIKGLNIGVQFDSDSENSFSQYDINQDGSVNVQDVQLVVNVILGNATNSRADVDNSGDVNVQDVQAVVNEVVG